MSQMLKASVAYRNNIMYKRCSHVLNQIQATYRYKLNYVFVTTEIAQSAERQDFIPTMSACRYTS